MTNPEDLLVEEVSRYSKDPLGYVKFAYRWGHGALEGIEGPRKWQQEILSIIGEKLQNPSTRFQPIQIAVASGHGIGKSALISMITNWALSTAPDTRIIITANTDTQLRNKTMPEVTKWHNLSITSHWFETTATAIYSTIKKREKAWRLDSIPWSIHNTEAFAGAHNAKKRIVMIMDEASAIDDRIWQVTEGALTDDETEIIWIAFGNPTRNTGRFRECFKSLRHRWVNFQIDSRTVEGTNKDQLEKWVADYGENSDFVKVRVRGMFPNASAKQFISTADVDAACGRHLLETQYNWAPKIITCDPAWEGDDELVIAIRQGLMFNVLSVIPKNDNDVFIANMIARFEDEFEADAVFIDGGYGTGIVSVGRSLKRNWQIIWFGEESSDPGCLNKRAEMWNSMKRWLKEGGAIPKDQVLYNDLISPETLPRPDGKIQLESKKDMKARGIPSPGRADALALSFAMPVMAKGRELYSGLNIKHSADYDPYTRE